MTTRATRTIRVDTRVIAATNQFLEAEIQAGRFREDLYYRLNVVPIHLPPLRQRREDIPVLARFFFERYSEQNRRDAPECSPGVLKVLQTHDWPGNVRELENWIERAVVLTVGQELTPELLLSLETAETLASGGPSRLGALQNLIKQLVRTGIRTFPSEEGRLYEQIVGGVERELIEQVLERCGQVQVKAASRLGINRNTLHKKLSEFGHADGEGEI